MRYPRKLLTGIGVGTGVTLTCLASYVLCLRVYRGGRTSDWTFANSLRRCVRFRFDGTVRSVSGATTSSEVISFLHSPSLPFVLSIRPA
ncbi:hypothetical protein BDW22DRAFT_1351197 [Trametopsis cervina]|nr:hypothetical protein BDW22DRAFT_1351197 [Trametopsis cervina]